MGPWLRLAWHRSHRIHDRAPPNCMTSEGSSTTMCSFTLNHVWSMITHDGWQLTSSLTAMGERQKSFPKLHTCLRGSMTQKPALMKSAISEHKNSWCRLAEGWGPLWAHWLMVSEVQGGLSMGTNAYSFVLEILEEASGGVVYVVDVWGHVGLPPVSLDEVFPQGGHREFVGQGGH